MTLGPVKVTGAGVALIVPVKEVTMCNLYQLFDNSYTQLYAHH